MSIMLVSKKKKAFTNHHSLLCAGTKLVGDLYFSGDLYLEGTVTGNIYAVEGKAAKLVVAETALVEGEVHVPNAIINGHVKGSIYSSKHIELAAKAVVEGTIHYQLIEMVKGSRLIGQMISNQSLAVEQNSQSQPTVEPEAAIVD
jgi:cytoskeletal protein CcmA (bactofilin family)